MENQELNEKLAKWRWGEDGIEVHGENREFIYIRGTWNKIDKEYNISPCPNFPADLNAIFRWLVPKITEQGHLIAIAITENINRATIIHNHGVININEYDTLPALVLCKAIEQLIDNGSK